MSSTSTRQRVLELVSSNPGVHFNDVVRRLDIAPGQAQYHLRRLDGDDEIRPESRYGRTHYFTDEFDDWERHAVAVLRRETARDIASLVLAQAAVRPTSVANTLGIARSTLEHHLDHLIAADVVRKHGNDSGHVTLTAPRPDETLRLLDLVTPTFPDRLLDRFERLVDSL